MAPRRSRSAAYRGTRAKGLTRVLSPTALNLMAVVAHGRRERPRRRSCPASSGSTGSPHVPVADSGGVGGSGSRTWNDAPPPGRSCTHARPPWSSAKRATRERPMPTPGAWAAAPGPWRKGSNRMARSSCGTPPPAPISAIPAISAPPSAADPDGASGDGLDIPDFLDRRPELRPAGDRLDDLR